MNLARKALLILPILFIFVMPLAASADSAAVGSANWHIIPDACKCPGSAPDFGCVLQVTQNVMNLGVYLALILMTIAIATAGFLWIFAPISAQNREMAKSTLTNAVIGIVIVLSAWLVVDFVMKKLYGQDNAWGPWNEILHANGGECIRTIASTGTQPSTNNNGSQGGVQTTPNPPSQSGPTNSDWQSYFTFDSSSIRSQAVSGPLNSLLSCMANKLSTEGHAAHSVGRISAITDTHVGNNTSLITHCATVGHQGDASCIHTVNSCHYGGRSCAGASYAVDFGDQENNDTLRAAARSCNSSARWNPSEGGSHAHISVGAGSCGCDTNLPGV